MKKTLSEIEHEKFVSLVKFFSFLVLLTIVAIFFIFLKLISEDSL